MSFFSARWRKMSVNPLAQDGYYETKICTESHSSCQLTDLKASFHQSHPWAPLRKNKPSPLWNEMSKTHRPPIVNGVKTGNLHQNTSPEEKNQYPFLKDGSIDFVFCLRVFPRALQSAADNNVYYDMMWTVITWWRCASACLLLGQKTSGKRRFWCDKAHIYLYSPSQPLPIPSRFNGNQFEVKLNFERAAYCTGTAATSLTPPQTEPWCFLRGLPAPLVFTATRNICFRPGAASQATN